MPERIKASEQNLGVIFSDKYFFEIPQYQRPYAWTTEEVVELLDDLLDAMERDPESSYFLGSIVLIKNEDKSQSQVVDGQQRLTTLSMVLCVLSELAIGTAKKELEDFIWEAGSNIRGTEDRFRLKLREQDQQFFEKNVQRAGAIDNFLKMDTGSFSDSQKLIFDNVELLKQELAKLDDSQRKSLAKFMAGQCYLVVVTATDIEFAYRIFSTLNDRGLDLSPTDILKTDIIGPMSDANQKSYGTKWEDIEADSGRESFHALFTHIRMIKLKTKSRRTLQEDFRKNVLNDITGEHFIDDVLEPYVDVYQMVSKASYGSAQNAEKVNAYLRHLGRLDNSDWIPPTMEFFRRNLHNQEVLAKFTKDLERLAYGMFISRANVNERIERYAKVLQKIEQGDAIWQDDGPLQLRVEEKNRILQILDGPVYSLKRVRLPLLLRLDSLMAEAGATYDYSTISIEHVLPQSPAEGSEWRIWFPDDEEREQWTHRLANLALLSRRKNASASNLEFTRKKNEYFLKGGVSPFALTTWIASKSEWTPDVLEGRQRELIGYLKKEWRLD